MQGQPAEPPFYCLFACRRSAAAFGQGGSGVALPAVEPPAHRAIGQHQPVGLLGGPQPNHYRVGPVTQLRLRARLVEVHGGRPYIFMEMVVGDERYGTSLTGWIQG